VQSEADIGVAAQSTTQRAALVGRTVVITRPAGTATALARQVYALGGVPVLLPGLSLRAVDDPETARAQLAAALQDELLVFTSPAAVRYAHALMPLKTCATVFAVGQGTALALQRHGITAQAPVQRQDSEGLLALPSLQVLRDRRVALIGAPGGRGLLREQLVARGAQLREVHVYRRAPPRLDRRHIDAVLHLSADARILLSSAEALQNLLAILPPPAQSRLCAAMAIVSSERLAEIALAAGFTQIRVAASARSADLLDAAI
jgi:uroporphyrinogen-III synthase